MWLSDTYKVMFFHNIKTGGISIGRFLKDHMDGYVPARSHRMVQDIKREFPEQFATYFKFGFVRNPWERVVSSFEMRRTSYRPPLPNSIGMTFDEYVYKPIDGVYVRQTQWLGRANDIWIDFVGRFENLQTDFTEVCRRVGYQGDPTLLHFNSSGVALNDPTVPKAAPAKPLCVHPPYWEYYTDATRDYVAEKCREDIALFGYTFMPATVATQKGSES